MASCSRAFRRPKNAEEEKKLIENATPKSTRAVVLENFFLEWPNCRKTEIQYSSLASSQLTSLECNAWTLL